jgi:hypothetical protein
MIAAVLVSNRKDATLPLGKQQVSRRRPNPSLLRRLYAAIKDNAGNLLQFFGK